ncbi:MAG: sulfatase [Myxococcota bacterium]
MFAPLSAVLACAGAPEPTPIPPPRTPNLVVVSMDGFRADRAHFDGNPRPTTPNLDAFAAEGVRFPNAFSQSNESLLSHASLFTGRYASEVAWPDYMRFSVPPDATTLAEAMSAVGYDTAAFLAGGHIRAEFGFDQGFATFWESQDFGSFHETVPPALAWIGERADPRPFLIVVHGYDLHRPYAHRSVFYHPFDADYTGPMEELVRDRVATEKIFDGAYWPDHAREAFRHAKGMNMSDPASYRRLVEASRRPGARKVPLTQRDLDHMVAHYDAAVLTVDTYVGLLIEGLKKSGAWDDTLVILTSDHGEDLQTHRFSNHRAVLFDSTSRVPFLVGGGALPAAARGTTRPELVDATDLVPTAMALAGSVPPAGTRGNDLGALLAGEPGAPTKDAVFQQGVLGQSSVRTATHRLVFSGYALTDPTYGARLRDDPLDGGSFALYAVKEDPNELTDVLARDRAVAEDLRARLVAWYGSLRAGSERVEISPETRKMLADHGYW